MSRVRALHRPLEKSRSRCFLSVRPSSVLVSVFRVLVASPLTAVTPVFVFILGILFLKEKVSAKNTLGLVVATGGILLLSLNGI